MDKFLYTRYRIGNGIDVHPLVKEKKLILGGVHIENKFGCDGYSDGDVLVHSIIDALLGAVQKGDIGDYFPSFDEKYKDISSISLLPKIKEIISPWHLENIDSTIILQSPILKPYIQDMKNNLYKDSILFNRHSISIKATTTDHLGFIGRGEGIAVLTTCLLSTTP